jgi:hypothetical protein
LEGVLLLSKYERATGGHQAGVRRSGI